MSICPECSPEHRKPFGRREDSESFNATYKSRLNDSRVRAVGRVRNQPNLLAFAPGTSYSRAPSSSFPSTAKDMRPAAKQPHSPCSVEPR